MSYDVIKVIVKLNSSHLFNVILRRQKDAAYCKPCIVTVAAPKIYNNVTYYYIWVRISRYHVW